MNCKHIKHEKPSKLQIKLHKKKRETSNSIRAIGFLHGLGSCKERNCQGEHNLDYLKIRRGMCFKEFFESRSCRRGDSCKFTHQVPEQLRLDEEFCNHIRNQWKEKNKNQLRSADTFSLDNAQVKHNQQDILNFIRTYDVTGQYNTLSSK